MDVRRKGASCHCTLLLPPPFTILILATVLLSSHCSQAISPRTSSPLATARVPGALHLASDSSATRSKALSKPNATHQTRNLTSPHRQRGFGALLRSLLGTPAVHLQGRGAQGEQGRDSSALGAPRAQPHRVLRAVSAHHGVYPKEAQGAGRGGGRGRRGGGEEEGGSLPRGRRALIQGAADEEGAEEVHPGGGAPFDTEHAHEGRVQKLEFSVESGKLKALNLAIHEQHERLPRADTLQKSGGPGPGASGAPTPQQFMCPSKPCPDVTPCTHEAASVKDPTLSSCWNPDLEDLPIKVRPTPMLGHWMPQWNPLDLCTDDVSGAPGDIIRPGCPWKGDRWGGEAKPPEGRDGEWWQDGWAGQVFVLENVFLDANGRVFNATHLFDVGGCLPSTQEFSYQTGTGTTHILEVVNLMAAAPPPKHGQRARKAPVLHATAYELPLLLPVLRMLPEPNKAILATRNKKFHRLVSSHLMGTASFNSKLHTIAAPAPGTLWLVKRLIQPVFQACNQPSPSLWRRLRLQHLLPAKMAAAAEAEAAASPPQRPLVPPSTPLIPWDWVVVVHDKVLTGLHNPPRFMAMLRQFFRAERILVFASGKSVQEDKELLNRAALFVTSSHAALANAILLPPNATVLELRLASQPPPKAAESELAVALAQACDVRAEVLFCGSERGDGMLYCPFEGLLEILDRVAVDAYTAHPPPRVSRPESGAGAGGGSFEQATGWFAKPKSEVKQFEDWAGCVAQKGKWVMDPTPRTLPWEYSGFINLCDHRHVNKGGLASKGADKVVLSGGTKEDWHVRNSLKYIWWVPPAQCPVHQLAPNQEAAFAPFSGFQFCKRVGKGRTILFLGDSLQEQFFNVFLNNLLKHLPKPATWALKETVPEECTDWLVGGPVKHKYCLDVRVHTDVCPGLRLLFVRSDFLSLFNPRAFDRIQYSRLSFLAEVDIAVINRGAHYRPTDIFARDLEAVLRYFRNRFPKLVLIYRNTPPGHKDCEKAWQEPLHERQDPATLPYYWGEFVEQNKVAEELVARHDYIYMDVDTMTALRADGHKGWREDNITDCLHYCTPGPLDVWPQHLYNTLMWVHPLPRYDQSGRSEG